MAILCGVFVGCFLLACEFALTVIQLWSSILTSRVLCFFATSLMIVPSLSSRLLFFITIFKLTYEAASKSRVGAVDTLSS